MTFCDKLKTKGLSDSGDLCENNFMRRGYGIQWGTSEVHKPRLPIQ